MAREELEVTRACRATDALRREMEQAQLEAAKREGAEHAQRENAQRLEGLKVYGHSCATGLPIDCRQRVITMLQEFVTTTNLPPSLSDYESRALVAAKVAQVREQHDAQERRKLEEVVNRLKVTRLITPGREIAAQLTDSWDPRDAEVARAEVSRELARCVEPDWSDAEVRRLVEDTLDEWEDADDEGDFDEAEDDDEEWGGG
jgi:hypothetical protein